VWRLVARATTAAREAGFTRSCLPEVGRLLYVLTTQVRDGAIAELGAGYGVGAAWIADALAPGVEFVTVERDSARAEGVRELLAGHPGVEVVNGDWREALQRGPFRLIFVDVAEAKGAGASGVIAALAPGGLALLDDFTPPEQQPPAWRGRRDAEREIWLNHPSLRATEIIVNPGNAVILATRAR